MKIINPIICLLLFNAAGCGLGNNGRNQSNSSHYKLPTGTVTLNNQLNSEDLLKLQESSEGQLYYHFGAFDYSQLPALQSVPTESEIGTLSVIRENEVYQGEYKQKVESIFNEKLEETKLKVFLIKSENAQQFYFGIKKNEEYNPLLEQQQEILVRSLPRTYCSIFFTQQFEIAKNVFFKARQYKCDPDGTCLMSVFTGAPYWLEIIQRHNINEAMFAGHSACHETQIYYDKNETKINSSKAKTAIVLINENIGLKDLKLKFKL